MAAHSASLFVEVRPALGMVWLVSILETPPSPYLTHTVYKKAKPKPQNVGS